MIITEETGRRKRLYVLELKLEVVNNAASSSFNVHS